MPDVTQTVDVHVPVRAAYGQWTRFESFPQFMDGVEAIQQLDTGRTHWVTEVGGVRREFDAEITEQRPDERIAWKSVGGGARHAGVVTFRPLGDDDTRVTVQLVWQPEGFVEKVGAVLGADGHQIKADMRRFKEFVERNGGEAEGWQPAAEPWRPGADPEATTQITRTGAPSPDVVDVLLSQHEQIKQALDRVAAAGPADKRQAFISLVSLLHLHEIGEQQVVHPVSRADTHDGDQVVGESVAEERQADQLIARLTEMGTDHAGFDAAFAKFHQAVLTHAEYEESEEFPRLRREVAVEKLHAMAEELLANQDSRL